MKERSSLLLVYDALRRINEMRPQDRQIPEQPDIVLVGSDGLLDSLELTTLILFVETRLRETTGRDVPLMQEGDFDVLTKQFETPFSIAKLIAEKS